MSEGTMSRNVYTIRNKTIGEMHVFNYREAMQITMHTSLRLKETTSLFYTTHQKGKLTKEVKILVVYGGRIYKELRDKIKGVVK